MRQLRTVWCFVVCVLALLVATLSARTIPVFDDFNRADSSTLGTEWTTISGGVRLISNAAGQSAGSRAQAAWTAEALSNDQWAQATVTAIDTTKAFGVCVHMSATGGGQGYCFTGTTVNAILYRVSGGTTLTNVATLTGSVALSSVIKLEIVGTTLTAYKNGVSIGTASDSTAGYNSGAPGVYLGDSPTTRLDDFQADNIGGGGGGGSAPGGLLLRGVGAALWHRVWPFDSDGVGLKLGIVGRANIPRQRVGVNQAQPHQQQQRTPDDQHDRRKGGNP